MSRICDRQPTRTKQMVWGAEKGVASGEEFTG